MGRDGRKRKGDEESVKGLGGGEEIERKSERKRETKRARERVKQRERKQLRGLVQEGDVRDRISHPIRRTSVGQCCRDTETVAAGIHDIDAAQLAGRS